MRKLILTAGLTAAAALAGCSVQKDPGNGTTTVSFDQNKLENTADSLQNAATNAADEASNRAGPAISNAGDAISNAADRAGNSISNAADRTKNVSIDVHTDGKKTETTETKKK